jgi:hypothetical protein
MRASGKRRVDLAGGDTAMPQPRASDAVARPAKQATPDEDAEAVDRSSGGAQERSVDEGFSLGRASPAADSGFGLDTAPADVDPSFPVQAAPSAAGADVSAATQDEAKEDAGSAVKSNIRFMTQEAFEFFWNRGRHHFVRLGNQTVALKRAAAELKNRVVDEGGVIGLRPPSEFERYIEGRRAGKHLVRDASLETIEIAKLRREWEEAAASGDPDRMTRTANALIRAEAAESARAGREFPPPREQILNPTGRPIGDKREAGRLVADDAIGRASGKAAFAHMSPGGHVVHSRSGADPSHPHSDADVGPGEIARAPGPQADDDVGSGQITWDSAAGADGALPGEDVGSAVDAIVNSPPERRANALRQVRERLGDAAWEVVWQASPGSMAVDRMPEDNREDGLTSDLKSDDVPASNFGQRESAEATDRMVALRGNGGSIPAADLSLSIPLVDPPVRRKCEHDFCVPRDWRLRQPTSRGGWIIQQVKIETSWIDENGVPRHDIAYFYEAWYIPANSDRPIETLRRGDPPYPNDSIGFDGKPGTRGDVKFTVSARFYEGLSLDVDRFKRGNADAYAGNLFATVPTKTPQGLSVRNRNRSPVRSSNAVDREWNYSWGW